MPELTTIYTLGNFIDTYALGHYARVMAAMDERNAREVALKVMRPEHLDPGGSPRWESKAFVNEVELLTLLERNKTPMQFYDCGYLSAASEYPTGGEIVSFGTDVNAFRDELFAYHAKGWRPYIALERLSRSHNLMYLMKPGQRRRLPTEEALNLAMQFGQLLYDAHEIGIVYLDHKLEHVYWDGQTLRVIDWNSSKRMETSGQKFDNACRKDIHNLCVGILYPIFTGLSPQRGGLRPQPANMPDVETRYSDITQLDFTLEPSLSAGVIDLLENGARQEIGTAQAFLQQVEQAATAFGWEFRYQNTAPMAVQARDHIRSGLEKLRASMALTREARELLMEAAILDGINEDMENELRRLMKGITDFLNARPIP